MLVLLAAGCTAEVAPVDMPGPKQERSRRPATVASEPSKAPAPNEASTTVLAYAKKTALRGYDVGSGKDYMLRAVPGPDVTLSPDGTRLAIVRDKDPGADPEGFADPYLSVAGVSGPSGEQAETELGPGRSAYWSADGRRIAAVTGDGVVVYDVAQGGSSTVLAGQGWVVLGWSGGRVVAIGDETTVLAGPDDTEDLGISPITLWGVSPADDTALVVEGARPFLVRDRQRTDIDVSVAIGDGAWSPDGSLIAAVRHGPGASRVITIDAATGATREVEDSRGAQGNVVWSEDSRRFAFVRVDPNDNLALQAVICELDGPCEPAFTWNQGVLLLGFAAI